MLSMFSEDKRLSRKRYKEFVSGESSEEINVILGKKKLPSMLGCNEFTEWVKRTFFSEKRHEEVPESRSLAPDVRRIMAVVSKSYGVDEQALTLTRRGIAKYSSVSSVVERMKAKIAKDRRLKKCAVELKEEINMSQEQT